MRLPYKGQVFEGTAEEVTAQIEAFEKAQTAKPATTPAIERIIPAGTPDKNGALYVKGIGSLGRDLVLALIENPVEVARMVACRVVEWDGKVHSTEGGQRVDGRGRTILVPAADKRIDPVMLAASAQYLATADAEPAAK